MAIASGNIGTISIAGVSECDITSWTASINKELISYTTMCLSGANAFLEGTTTVTGTIESLEWLGDVTNGAVSLSNEVLTISAADAFFNTIDISTAVGELVSYTYNFTISGPYTITVA